MSEALRILILEDQPADAELVTRELRKAGIEFVAKTVTTEKEFLAELRDFAPQLILADYSLPGYDGLSALVAAQKQCPETPFIFVSGSMGEEKAIETLHRGATDYVLKQRLARLEPAVRRALREQEEMRKRLQAEKERHEAEAGLRESEKQLRAMFDLASVGMAQADPRTGQWLRVNQKMCAITGYSAAELLRMRVPEITHPDDRQKDWEEFQRAVRGEAPDYRLEKRYLRKDGAVAWVNVNMTVILDAAGQPVRTMATIEDITERKQLEKALRESGQFNQQIVASAQEGIVVYSRDLRYQVWNPFMEHLTGLPASQVLGTHPDELFPFLREAGVLASIQKTLTGEPLSSIEVHVEGQPTGISGWTSQTNGPLRNAAGEIIGVIGIVQDITERKRAELRIRAFANLGQRLNAAKTAREAGQIIVAVADELLGWDACLFDLYSAAENRMSEVLSMDLINGRRTECQRHYLDPEPMGAARRAIAEGGQLILRDLPNAMQPEGLPFGDKSRPSASLMFVPIRHGTEVVGVLSIQSYTPGAYGADSLEALQALADYGGGALERLRAQEALNESETTFRSVWERSIDGMRLTDKDGRIIAVNEAFCQFVKLPREKLEGQMFSVVYKGHGAADGIELYLKRFATGEIVPHLTTRAQLWNGEELDLEISSSFVELAQRGKMLLSIFRDVSERKRAEVRIEAFSKLGKTLSAARSPAEAARTIYASADLFWKWDCGVLDLESPESGCLYTVMAYDVVDGQRREVTPPDPASAVSARSRRVMAQGAELILRKAEEPVVSDTIRIGDASRLSASIMCVPVRAEDRVVGVLSIQSYTPDAYTREDLQTLQALADHCGGALERLGMEGALRESERR
jgi:PAS domain S-box-containing protein